MGAGVSEKGRKNLILAPAPDFWLLFSFMGPYLKIIGAMLIWSTWGVMIRWIGQPPVIVLFATSLVASITVPLVLTYRGEFDLTGTLRSWFLFGILGAASLVNNLTYFYALGHTTVSNAVFTHYTAPIFVAVLAPLLIAERLQRVTIIALPIAAIGMYLIVSGGDGLVIGQEHREGIIAGTVSGAAYAVLIIISRLLSQKRMHHKAVIAILWLTTAATAPAALRQTAVLDVRTLILLASTGIFHSTIAPLLYYSALRSVLAQHASILGFTEPLAALPLAFLVLGETPVASALFGGLLILLSGYLILHRAVSSDREKK